MSERYGICRPCHGRGRVLTEKGREQWKQLRASGRITVKADELEWIECGGCEGSGQDGSADAFNHEDSRSEREEQASRDFSRFQR